MTKEYEAAIAAHNAAIKVYEAALAKFRSIPGIATKADFAEFAAAQKAKKEADVDFDIAFEAEASIADDAVVDVVELEDDQLDLFA